MKILHYSLGFPPQRRGGLVKYSLDLARQQVKDGHSVFFLYPGLVGVFRKRVSIVEDKKRSSKNFQVFSLRNSLPLPLLGGIKSPKDFMKKMDSNVYLKFLKKISPDVIHIHTLMGLHLEFLQVAKKLGIRLVYTTHDYFGIFCNPTFYFQGKDLSGTNSIEEWVKVSHKSLTTRTLRLLQTKHYALYRSFLLKIRRILSFFVARHGPNDTKSEIVNTQNFSTKREMHDFLLLRSYYAKMFSLINIFHFNSSTAAEVFRKHLKIKQSVRLSITNSSVQKHFIKTKQIVQKIGYVGPYQEYKGFYKFLKLASNMGPAYEFHIFGDINPGKLPTNVIDHGKFTSNQLRDVYSKLDLLIVPSLWKETFGFVTLEALSFGVKVLVSKNVGSSDLIDSKYIFNNIERVPSCFNILSDYYFPPLKSMKDHAKEIYKLYLK